GWEVMRQSPSATTDLVGLKLLRWFSSVEYSTEYSLAGEREAMIALRLPFVPFGFLAVGGLVGLVMAWKTYPRLPPAPLYLFAAWTPPMIFYGSSRYRIAAVPALAVLSAAALERMAARARAGSWMDAAPYAAAVLLLGTLTLVPYGRDHLIQDANVHYNTG